MPARIEQPGPTARQVSGKDPAGRSILSVLVKRTYTLIERRECLLAEEQVPLQLDLEFDPDLPALLLHDLDLYPYKPRTDVIVKGHAHGDGSRRQFEVGVRVGAASKCILVVGDRACSSGANGKLVFSNPEPITRVPLRYTHAYGGRDAVAEAAVLEEMMRESADDAELLPKPEGSPFLYPRNPCGRGFLMRATPQAVEAVRLPNLEDPLDLLSPERLEVGEPLQWPRMPIPQATDWVAHDWFPRIAGLGVVPLHLRTAQPFAEVTRGFVPEAVIHPANWEATDAFHLTCGASLGLQLQHVQPGEQVMLENLHPKLAEFTFRLSNERPKIWTDGRQGKLNETQPVIHSLVIEPEAARLTVVWRGSALALRPYQDAELEKMPLRVEW